MFATIRPLSTALAFLAALASYHAPAYAEERVARSTQPNAASVKESTASQQRVRPRNQQRVSDNRIWVHNARTELFFDDDDDGYYTRLVLDFDVDTVFDHADVYAVLYLSFELGPWQEYADTDVFRVFGRSGDDNYVLETDLVEGFPRGSYDLLIEVYDAFDDRMVAEFGPDDSSNLALLPLEDQQRDDSFFFIAVGGGGSTGLFSVLGLLVLLFGKQAQHTWRS